MGVSLSEGATGVLGGITTSSNVLVLLRSASAGKEICKDNKQKYKKQPRKKSSISIFLYSRKSIKLKTFLVQGTARMILT